MYADKLPYGTILDLEHEIACMFAVYNKVLPVDYKISATIRQTLLEVLCVISADQNNNSCSHHLWSVYGL